MHIWKGYGTQQCLLVIIEKCRQNVNKGGHYGALLTELLTLLSKVFDCLSHDLLMVKLRAYGFDIPVLRLFHNYLQTENSVSR